MDAGWVAVGAVGAVVVWVVWSYNRFVEQRTLVRDGWATVETELQRRYDLIPNLVETVRAYARHEESVLRAVTDARARAAGNHGDPADQARDERDVVGTLRRLLAVSEGYPELAASDSFLALQRELANTEDRIQAARRFHNGNVRSLNRRVRSFPSNLVAAAFGIGEGSYFEIDEAVRRAGAPAARP